MCQLSEIDAHIAGLSWTRKGNGVKKYDEFIVKTPHMYHSLY
jgi:hypothetical protein